MADDSRAGSGTGMYVDDLNDPKESDPLNAPGSAEPAESPAALDQYNKQTGNLVRVSSR